MESINNNKIRYRFLAFVLAFMVAIAPLGNIKKVKAIAGVDDLAFITITALVISGLAAAGLISGGYQVSGPDLAAISEKAQANLQAAGSAAIDQANKLGEAIKSGAESAKIKALASGAVIYAFLQAIQDTLFPEKIKLSQYAELNEYLLSRQGYCVLAGYCGDYAVIFDGSRKDNIPINGIVLAYAYTNGTNYYTVNYTDISSLSVRIYDPYAKDFVKDGYRYWSGTLAPKVVLNKSYVYWPSLYPAYLSNVACIALGSPISGTEILGADNKGYTSSASSIASAPSVSLPTRLPTTIINNINNWDGTSDLVLAPPLPYDIPTGEDLVIDPSYVGEGTIDPPKPTTDPDPPAEEEGISLPWLSALLALLGLGQIGGIDAGVQSGIDSIIDGITATAQDVFDGSKEILGNITDALTGIDAGIQSGIDALTGSISVPLANIADFALSVPDFFAIPEGKSIATPIIEQIPTVFPIVDQMNTALNKITVETRPLIIYYPYLDGSTKEINLNWYEPAREQVKHGVGLLFKVVTALACFAMVSNVFGIGIRVGAGQAYTDNNSGGGNSRKKED